MAALLKRGAKMKLFIALLLVSFSVFAQDYSWPTYPYRTGVPFPENFPPHRDQFCTGAELQKTQNEVVKVCENKVEEFVAEHLVTCELTKVSLKGCRAVCKRDQEVYAKLKMMVNSNCYSGEARLRKTVFTFLK